MPPFWVQLNAWLPSLLTNDRPHFPQATRQNPAKSYHPLDNANVKNLILRRSTCWRMAVAGSLTPVFLVNVVLLPAVTVVAQNAIARVPETAAAIAPNVNFDAVVIFILALGCLQHFEVARFHNRFVHYFNFLSLVLFYECGVGRGCGLGRVLGTGIPLGVGIGRGVEVGVTLAVAVAVGEGVAIGVDDGVGVGVTTGVGEGVGEGVAIGVDVGVGVGEGPWALVIRYSTLWLAL